VSRRNVPGTIYLLHLERPYVPYPGALPCACAQHYTGFAEGGARELARRLAEHGTSHGSPLLLAARQAGITWELARTWDGTRARERQLKRQGSARRYCPLCGVRPVLAAGELPTNCDGSLSRSRIADVQLAAVGLMTRAQLAEHTALRRGAARGRVAGAVRLVATPAGDPWYRLPEVAGSVS
jgi:hypothetical protein